MKGGVRDWMVKVLYLHLEVEHLLRIPNDVPATPLLYLPSLGRSDDEVGLTRHSSLNTPFDRRKEGRRVVGIQCGAF